MDVVDNYHVIQEQVSQEALRYGRDPQTITIVVVTKSQSVEKLLSLYDAGVRDFGESRVQEALQKMKQAPQDIRWHLIGTLQKNKVKHVAGRFVLIHSVDSLPLAEAISKVSLSQQCVTNILLQVNTSHELTKHGYTCEEWKRFFPQVLELSGIEVQGLMTIAPFTEDETAIKNCFADLQHLRDELMERYGDSVTLKHLSMGMTNDYHIAIVEGATLVRIGTAILGKPEN